jgi:hypothetical protein
MPQSNRDPIVAETGEQVPARPHDTGIQTKLLMAWTPRPSRCGARQKTRLLLPRRMISKKHRYLTGQAKRRKFEGEFSCQLKNTAQSSKRKKHGTIIETPTEARQAGDATSVLPFFNRSNIFCRACM